MSPVVLADNFRPHMYTRESLLFGSHGTFLNYMAAQWQTVVFKIVNENHRVDGCKIPTFDPML
jgi:hypothetical protein